MINLLKWYRLSVLFHAQPSPSAKKSHPVSVFQAIIKAVSSQTPGFVSLDNTALPLFHIRGKKHSFTFTPHEPFMVDFFFCQHTPTEITQWRQNLLLYIATPVYSETVGVLSISAIEERSYAHLTTENPALSGHGELCLEFLMPMPFNPTKGKARVAITKEKFIHLFEKRLSQLFRQPVTYQPGDDDFFILPYYWRYTEIKHLSRSQPGTTQYINGVFGKLYLKGRWFHFIPFLLLGAELHTGNKLANAQGYYRILPASVPYFVPHFPNVPDLIVVAGEAKRYYPSTTEPNTLPVAEKINETTFAEKLAVVVQQGNYQAAPNKAWMVQNKENAPQVQEQMTLRDWIVSRYLKKTLYKIFDTLSGEDSIGSRKGLLPSRVTEKTEAILAAGYKYKLELTLEDFFPAVDLTRLRSLLDDFLPEKDTLIRHLLDQLTSNGYMLEGQRFERINGLALGNPLSSCLTNFYLFSFAGHFKEGGIQFIRSGDTIIIFGKTVEEMRDVRIKMKLGGYEGKKFG